jgi:hypothetical protein
LRRRCPHFQIEEAIEQFNRKLAALIEAVPFGANGSAEEIFPGEGEAASSGGAWYLPRHQNKFSQTSKCSIPKKAGSIK